MVQERFGKNYSTRDNKQVLSRAIEWFMFQPQQKVTKEKEIAT